MLIQQIEDKYKQAMFAKDTKTVSVMRMLKSNIQNKSIELQIDLDDIQIANVIKSMVKRNDESIEMFVKGNRQDLVDDYSKENEILKEFLPQMLDGEETKILIKNLMAVDNQLGNKSTIGGIMKILKDYDYVDMKLASKILKEIL